MSTTRYLLKPALIITVLLSSCMVWGQPPVEQTLIKNFNKAKGVANQVVALMQLSDYYYAIKEFTKGDSIIEKQIILAESSLDTRLALLAYFQNAAFQSSALNTKEQSLNTRGYIERAMAYARANNFTDYIAMAYAATAALNITDGSSDKAFKNASLAFTTALNTTNDSARVVCAIELGNIHLHRSEMVTAFKTYTNALNIATEHKDESLKPFVFHAIATLYKKLGKEELAKSYIYKSRDINEKSGNIPGQINDDIFLAKLSNYTAAKQHLQEAIDLADSLQNIPLKIEAEKILFSYMLLREAPFYMLAYLQNHPELENLFINTGPGYINWMKAEIYLYGSMPDSAMVQFKKAEPLINTGYDLTSKKNFFSEYANCLKKLNEKPAAIQYYEKTRELSRATSDLTGLTYSTNELKNLYHESGDYKRAFEYGVMYDQYKDSVELLGKERDLAILEIENDTKEQQRQAEMAASALERKYNLQYMFITIVVATAFVLMIMIGMFKVSAFTIRLMGFLSLIFFFELIILFLDQKIHHLTHGEPWKIWLIKIGIISILLPIHHFLEHKLIHYLLSRHLITVRNRLSFSRFFKKKKNLPDQKDKEGA